MYSDGNYRKRASRQSSSSDSSPDSSINSSSDLSESSENSLIEYVTSLSRDEVNAIAESPVLGNKLKGFVAVLLGQQVLSNSFKTLKSDDSLHSSLRVLEETYSSKYKELCQLIKKGIAYGEKVIALLKKNSNYLDRAITIGSLFRLTGSAVDTLSTVSGLMLRRAQSGYAQCAFEYASLFGVVGLVSTVSEVAFSKSLLSEVMNALEEYQEHQNVINAWFQKTETFDQKLRQFLPYGIDSTIVKEIEDDSSSVDNYEKIFKAGLLSNLRKDKELIKNEEFYQKLDFLSKSSTAAHWWNWVIFREHPIVLDFARMKLQFDCDPNGSILFQSIPALPMEQQRFLSLPVGGRIVLNLLTIYDAINDLKLGPKYRSSEKMRKLLNDIIPQLDRLKIMDELMVPSNNTAENSLGIVQ